MILRLLLVVFSTLIVALLLVGAAALLANYSADVGATATGLPHQVMLPSVTRSASETGYVVAAAGDIACDPASTSFNGGNGNSSACAQSRTSDLLLQIDPDAVLALGDTQYQTGALSAFQQSYDPSWGRLKTITYPAIGNHEYGTANAAGYFDYFGSAAGEREKGYYAFDLGNWRLYALNTNCGQVGGCGAESPQVRWLHADLAANPRACSIAYWHHPRFSSGPHGNSTAVQTIWQALYDAGVDIALAGHDHTYERFALLDANGNRDAARGIRSFVVGSGGRSYYKFGTILPNSEARNGDTFGVLELTLHDGSYEWQFVPERGKSFTDAGSEACR